MTTAAVADAVAAGVGDEPQAPPLRSGMRMSLDDFLALGETEERLELCDGVLYLMSSASKDHQFLMYWIRHHFEAYLDGFDEPPAEVHHELTTILSREREQAPEPDIVVVLAGRNDVGGRIHVEGAPDIVVEILSSDRSHDLVYKRRVYAEAGVREYWVVDPRGDTVTLLELRGGGYVERGILGVGDTLATPLLPGLAIPLAGIFGHRRRPARDEA